MLEIISTSKVAHLSGGEVEVLAKNTPEIVDKSNYQVKIGPCQKPGHIYAYGRAIYLVNNEIECMPSE